MQFNEQKDRSEFSNLSQLVQLEDSPVTRAWIATEFDGDEERYLLKVLGKRRLGHLRAVAKRLDRQVTIWKAPFQKEGLSDGQVRYLNTRRHGEVSHDYIREDGGYDGDMEDDPRVPKEEQLSRSYVIPYVREKADDPERGVSKGDVIRTADGKYPKLAVYMARELPTKQLVLVADRLSYFVSNHMWGQFHRLLELFRQYRAAMRDRSPEVKTMDNGWKPVYFMEFDGVVLFSPITWVELTDEARARVQARFDAWKTYQANLSRLISWSEELQKVQEQLNGLLVGDDGAYSVFKAELKKLMDDVKIHAPWKWKQILSPFYKEIYSSEEEVDLFASGTGEPDVDDLLD